MNIQEQFNLVAKEYDWDYGQLSWEEWKWLL